MDGWMGMAITRSHAWFVVGCAFAYRDRKAYVQGYHQSIDLVDFDTFKYSVALVASSFICAICGLINTSPDYTAVYES